MFRMDCKIGTVTDNVYSDTRILNLKKTQEIAHKDSASWPEREDNGEELSLDMKVEPEYEALDFGVLDQDTDEKEQEGKCDEVNLHVESGEVQSQLCAGETKSDVFSGKGDECLFSSGNAMQTVNIEPHGIDIDIRDIKSEREIETEDTKVQEILSSCAHVTPVSNIKNDTVDKFQVSSSHIEVTSVKVEDDETFSIQVQTNSVPEEMEHVESGGIVVSCAYVKKETEEHYNRTMGNFKATESWHVVPGEGTASLSFNSENTGHDQQDRMIHTQVKVEGDHAGSIDSECKESMQEASPVAPPRKTASAQCLNSEHDEDIECNGTMTIKIKEEKVDHDCNEINILSGELASPHPTSFPLEVKDIDGSSLQWTQTRSRLSNGECPAGKTLVEETSDIHTAGCGGDNNLEYLPQWKHDVKSPGKHHQDSGYIQKQQQIYKIEDAQQYFREELSSAGGIHLSTSARHPSGETGRDSVVNTQNLLCTNERNGDNSSPGITADERPGMDNKQYQCTICGKKLTYISTLKRHVRTHSGEKPYQCTTCNKWFTRRGCLKQHMRNHTGENPYQCATCGKKFRNISYLQRHMRTHSGEKPYQCAKCDKWFPFMENLRQHMITHTSEKPYQCPVCQKTYALNQYLKQHMRSHTGEKPYQCTKCEKKFPYRASLRRHIRTHTDEKPHKATPCNKKCAPSGNLKKHTRTRTGEKPNQYTLCNNTFTQNAYPKKHTRSHKGDKPFKCTACDQSFHKIESLKEHVRTHTRAKPYECTTCNKWFALRVCLEQHMKTHTGEKPYQCTTCNKWFARRGSLKQHMRTHTGEKPYQCITCNKRFKAKVSLNVHIRNHAGEKPYQCTICKKRFAAKQYLREHIMRTHTGQKPYQVQSLPKQTQHDHTYSCN